MTHPYLNFSGHTRLPRILQTEAAECGLACLAMIASYHGHRIDLNTLRRRYPVSLNGVTMRGLIQVASQLHLASRPLRFELEGYWSARRGQYRVIYSILDDEVLVRVVRISHRSDVYG